MSKPLEQIRSVWQKGIEKAPFIGVIPFLGGVALTNAVIRKDLNELLQFGLEIGGGIAVHNRAHKLLGTEVEFIADEDAPIGWKVVVGVRDDSEQPMPLS